MNPMRPWRADLRQLVRQQIAQGKSDAEIEDYLVARYGDFILMKPPLQPDTYILWLAPFLVLIGAGAVATFVIARHAGPIRPRKRALEKSISRF